MGALRRSQPPENSGGIRPRPLYETVYQAYDADSNLTHRLDPKGRLYVQQFDAAGRLIQLDYPQMGAVPRREAYAYTALGDLTSQSHLAEDGALVRKILHAYDALGRQVQEKSDAGLVLNDLRRAYDADGNLESEEDLQTGAKTIYDHDPMSRLILSEQYQDGLILKSVFTLWTGASRKERVSGSDGESTRYAYDANGLSAQVYFTPPGGAKPSSRRKATTRPCAKSPSPTPSRAS